MQVNNAHLKQPMNARPTNVESAIPRTPQRDPANFPYEFREYPKAMNMRCTREYLDAWMERHKQFGDDMRPYWSGGRPQVDKSVVPILDEMGEPLFVQDEDEEREFRAAHPEALDIVGVQDEMNQLRADNDRLRALAAENDRLKAELANTIEGRDAELQRQADQGAANKLQVATSGLLKDGDRVTTSAGNAVVDAGKNGNGKKAAPELPKKL